MDKEDKEKLKQSLFYDYSWSSKEIEKFSMHIDDVIEATEQAINFTGSSLELPNVYEGSLNSERIKQVNNLKELYTINGTTISDIFCRGVNWYKQKLTKQAIT